MNYLTSSEIENHDGHDYLHIYLKPEYSYQIKHHDEEIEQNELYIKSPTMSGKDLNDLRRVVLSMQKFEDLHNKETMEYFSKIDKDVLFKLQQEIKQINTATKEKVTDEEARKSVREHVKVILEAGKKLETESTDFFKEFDRIANFMSSRLYRRVNDIMANCDLAMFDKLLGQKQFLLEEIFIEYVAFFFKHFPSETLISLNQRPKIADQSLS